MTALFGRPSIEHLDRYIARRQYDRALEALRIELERQPNNRSLLRRRAEIRELSGDTEGAIADYLALANRFASDGFYAKAIALHKKVLRLDPGREGIEEELARLIDERRRSSRPLAGRPSTPPERDGTTAPAPDPQIRKELEASAFFAAFSREALPELLRSTALRGFREGTVVVREGEPGASMFLIVEGRLSVTTVSPDGETVHLADLGPGDFFGEVSLLTSRPRTATVTATTPVTLIELAREDVDRLAQRYPQVRQVLQTFYERRAEATVEAIVSRLKAARRNRSGEEG